MSEIGKAMRMLYDRYGAEKIFNNSAYLVNGLGDLTEDSRKVRNQFKMVMDAGLGRVYLDQLSAGAPDAAFDARVRTLITEEAGLNEKAASEIAGYFDEMIGWREVKDASAQQAEQKQTKNDSGPEIDRKNSVNEDYGPEIDRKNPGGSAEKKSGGFKELYFYEKVAIILLPATIIAMIVMSGQEGFYDRMMNYNDALGFNTYRCCYFVPLIPFILSLGVTKRKLRDHSNMPATILTIAVFAFVIFSVLDFFSRVNLMNKLEVNSEQYYMQGFRLEEDMFMGLSCFLLAISTAVHRSRERKKANKA